MSEDGEIFNMEKFNQCLNNPDAPYTFHWDTASSKYILIRSKRGVVFFIKNSFLRRLWSKLISYVR